jgi:MFS family permease
VTDQRIIRTYLSIAATTTLAQSLIWGVNTLFLLKAGLSIFQVMLINAAFTVSQALFEVPTGVVADTVGRRVSYLLSVVIILASTLLYLWFGLIHAGVVPFALASVLLGIGFTFYTGAVDAWMVDALNSIGYQGPLDTVFAHYGMVFGLFMLIGTIGGGLLGQLGLWIPYVGRAIMLVPALVIGLVAMPELGFQTRELHLRTVHREALRIAREGTRYGLKDHVVRLLMSTTFVVGVFAMFGFYSWQKYFLDLLNRNLIWVAGVIAALVGLCQIAGNMLVAPSMRRLQSRSTILVAAFVVQAAGIVVAALARDFWVAVPFYLISTIAWGLMIPIKQSWMNSRIPSAQRATLISLDSLFGDAGGTVGQVGLGYASQAVSIPFAWLIGGLFQLTGIPLIMGARRADEGESTAGTAPAGKGDQAAA